MIKRLFICLAVGIAFGGCKKWYEIPTPSYILINNYTTKVASDGSQGTANQSFTDMQVTANGQNYGIWPIGSKVPVLISGQVSFVVKAVVEINGVSALRATYEVMKGCDTTWSVQFGQVSTVTPEFQYFAGTTFPWVNDFDAPNGVGYSGQGYTGIQVVSTNATSTIADTTIHPYSPGMGGRGGCLKLAPNAVDYGGVASVQSDPKHPIPLLSGGVGIYMEFNYLCNVPINIAIQGVPTNGTGPTAITACGGVYPTTTWNKTYIDLTEEVSTLQSGYYIIYITSLYDDLIGANYAYIDNIKIVQAQ